MQYYIRNICYARYQHHITCTLEHYTVVKRNQMPVDADSIRGRGRDKDRSGGAPSLQGMNALLYIGSD